MSKGPYYSEGKYLFKVVDQGFGESAKKQTPFFYLRGTPLARIIDGAEDPCERQYERDITLYLSEKAVDGTIDRLRGLGWQGSSFKELDVTGSVTFVGQVITVFCKHEVNDAGTWEGWGLPFEATSEKPPKPKSDPRIASKLDAMFGKSLKSTAIATPKPAAIPKPAAVRDDVDVPFAWLAFLVPVLSSLIV
jgi:hypothetical protein